MPLIHRIIYRHFFCAPLYIWGDYMSWQFTCDIIASEWFILHFNFNVIGIFTLHVYFKNRFGSKAVFQYYSVPHLVVTIVYWPHQSQQGSDIHDIQILYVVYFTHFPDLPCLGQPQVFSYKYSVNLLPSGCSRFVLINSHNKCPIKQ